jgi:hypothetical protein
VAPEKYATYDGDVTRLPSIFIGRGALLRMNNSFLNTFTIFSQRNLVFQSDDLMN